MENRSYLRSYKGSQEMFIITIVEYTRELTLLLLLKGWNIYLTYSPESDEEVRLQTNVYDLTEEPEKNKFVREVNTFGGPIVSDLKYDINLN
jgi:hypothetical protein